MILTWDTAMAEWVDKVMATSNAMDIESGTFSHDDPKEIAQAMYRNVMKSKRTKGTKFQSAMSILNFYINRAGSRLSPGKREILEAAKEELRVLFGKKEKCSKS